MMSGCKCVSEWLQGYCFFLLFFAYLLVVNTYKFSCVSKTELQLLFLSTILDKMCIFRKEMAQDR